MMELFWTPEATQDRDEIYDHIEADNPAAALTLDELFAEKAGHRVPRRLPRPWTARSPGRDSRTGSVPKLYSGLWR
jgi:plasmid stabilization system protein ParE